MTEYMYLEERICLITPSYPSNPFRATFVDCVFNLATSHGHHCIEGKATPKEKNQPNLRRTETLELGS